MDKNLTERPGSVGEAYDRLMQICEENKITELDDAIHDLYSQRASDLNNSGLGNQIKELISAYGYDETLRILQDGF